MRLLTHAPSSSTLPSKNSQVPAVAVESEKNKMLPITNHTATKMSLRMLSVS